MIYDRKVTDKKRWDVSYDILEWSTDQPAFISFVINVQMLPPSLVAGGLATSHEPILDVSSHFHTTPMTPANTRSPWLPRQYCL